MQGYFFVAATFFYAALKWRYILPKIFSSLDALFAADVSQLYAPITAVVTAIVSAGIVLLHDEGFYAPSANGTKMAYVTLAAAAIAIWIPAQRGHSLTVNSALLILAAYNLGTQPKAWWWVVIAINGPMYIGHMAYAHYFKQ